jgi:hypothetical protein
VLLQDKLLLLTPPFTQLNTPYPATAYLKGFLNTKKISSFQVDLGIEVLLAVFSKKGLEHVFEQYVATDTYSENAQRIALLKDHYCNTIDAVISFLQGKNPNLAHLIAQRSFLPEANRFAQIEDLQWAFGAMGIQDKAKYIATMYLEDVADFIQECIDPHFGFSRYAEKISRSANRFDELHHALEGNLSFIDTYTIALLKEKIEQEQPTVVAISVPFPGNLYAALRCGQFIKNNYPHIKVALGGGYANTELRSIEDKRVFAYVDFICLDDGEAPMEQLLAYCKGTIDATDLKRTFLVQDNELVYSNSSACKDYKQADVGTPDYSDLRLDQYISVIEMINPMHSLWSDGRWNKLTMAHGCYWGKCTFCDISLDYIKLYEPVAASLLCDRMEAIIQQTGTNGFHFVDEAAPPSLMQALALEIIKRKLVVAWWTNIRFEKKFTRDLCLLLKKAGCIGVSGGLEVASDRLLALIQKGITVAQVAKVNQHFCEAGIMVHAYLMYGFPTQTAQETIDSLEMVRQLFEANILHSAYWHQFTMTVHSPVGMHPEKFQVEIASPEKGSFANNDLLHIDPTGTDHEAYSYGLKKSLFNYMHKACFDYPLHKWFDFKVPKTSIASDFIKTALENSDVNSASPHAKVIFLGSQPSVSIQTKSKKGATWEVASLKFTNPQGDLEIKVAPEQGTWLAFILKALHNSQEKTWTLKEIKAHYEQNGLEDFELFWDNKPINSLYKVGLYHL